MEFGVGKCVMGQWGGVWVVKCGGAVWSDEGGVWGGELLGRCLGSLHVRGWSLR